MNNFRHDDRQTDLLYCHKHSACTNNVLKQQPVSLQIQQMLLLNGLGIQDLIRKGRPL
jgi:hypothetical protein